MWYFSLLCLARSSKHLEEVFLVIGKVGLKLKLSKCFSAEPQVKLFGHFVTAEEVSLYPEKISAIRNDPVLKTMNELCGLLRLRKYYRKFIWNFEKTSKILHADTSGNKALYWTSDTDKTYHKLKENHTSSSVPAYPDFRKQFDVETSASSVAVAAVVAHKKREGKFVPYNMPSTSCIFNHSRSGRRPPKMKS